MLHEHYLIVPRVMQGPTVSTKSEGKEKEQKHIRGALKICGYPNWTFVKTTKASRSDREEEMRKRNNIPCVAGTSETLGDLQ